MIDGITPLHLVLVLIIALIVVGPGKLPELGRSLGHGIREFRQGVSAVREPLEAVRQPFAAPTASATPMPPAAMSSHVEETSLTGTALAQGPEPASIPETPRS
jgi:sec-independent protein translocase protein TatA